MELGVVTETEFDVGVYVFSDIGECGERGGVGGSDFGLGRFFIIIDDAVVDSDSNILPEIKNYHLEKYSTVHYLISHKLNNILGPDFLHVHIIGIYFIFFIHMYNIVHNQLPSYTNIIWY